MAAGNQAGQPATAPVVWLLTDNKPGHRNQLKGLGNRLRVLAGVRLHWVDASRIRVPAWRALLGIAPAMDSGLPPPALVIAAGTGTHRLLLSLRRYRQTRTVVVMKPGFPTGWVHGAIIPAHDSVSAHRNRLITEGVINAITPMARVTTKPEALLLIGGPSRHYEWCDDVIVEQIKWLIHHYPMWRWTISGSRRTPRELQARLDDLAGLKVTVVDPGQTHEDWLNHRIAASAAIWVTPDSMSMVCEAATSGVPTGLFRLTPNTDSRVARGVEHLADQGYVARWSDHATVMGGSSRQGPSLWEADRAARWLISRWLQPGKRQAKRQKGNNG